MINWMLMARQAQVTRAQANDESRQARCFMILRLLVIVDDEAVSMVG